MAARSQSAVSAPAWLRTPAISPDGQTIVFTYRGDIYRVPAAGGAAIPLTTHDAHDTKPVWSHDGRRIIYYFLPPAAAAAGEPGLRWKPLDGSGPPERFTTSRAQQVPQAVTRDGRYLVFTQRTESN